MTARHWQQALVASLVLALSLRVAAAPSLGEHLVYTVGCVNCHHQTHKKIINAPPLVVVKAYSLPEFRRLMRTGITKTGRNMVAEGSVMGVVAQEQFAHFTDEEVGAIYKFLTTEWTARRGVDEEKKIPLLFKRQIEKGELPRP
jgi:hypothetical protein